MRFSWSLPLVANLFVSVVGLAASGPALAAQPPDQASIVSLQIENDAASTLKGTSDQYYTSGLQLGWTSGQDVVAPVAALGQSIWGNGMSRLSIEVSQSIFTPRQTQLSVPAPGDRPYAGVLLATFGIIHDTDWTRDLVSVSGGILGPSAQGEGLQNGFHTIIGDTPNRGWSHQLPDQPAFQILVRKTLRLPIASLGFVDADLLPSATVAVGDLRDYAQLGGVVRLGQGLGSDFGTSRIEPGLNGSNAFANVMPIAWYGFAGVDGQAVGYDATLDGSTFRTAPGGPGVHRIWDVGEMEAGAAVMWHGVRLTYTQTWQTQEFRGAKSGLFNFGSVTLSAKF